MLWTQELNVVQSCKRNIFAQLSYQCNGRWQACVDDVFQIQLSLTDVFQFQLSPMAQGEVDHKPSQFDILIFSDTKYKSCPNLLIPGLGVHLLRNRVQCQNPVVGTI